MSSVAHLWQFRPSHYNEKVRWALDFKQVPHRRTSFVPGFHFWHARRLTKQNQLPIVKIDGRVINDSTRIIDALEQHRPDPPLYPRDPDARARALALEDWFDEEVAPWVRRLFWSTYLDDADACADMATTGAGSAARAMYRAFFLVIGPLTRHNMSAYPKQIEQARVRVGEALDRIEAERKGGAFLVGDAFSVADLTAAALLSPIVRPPQFPYPPPEPWPSTFVALRNSFAGHAGFQWVLDTYAKHRGTSAEIEREAS